MLHSLKKGGDTICARYTVFSEEEITEMRAIIAEIGRRFGDGAVHTGEIARTNSAPVLTMEGRRLAPRPAAWGFPQRDGKGVLVNARSESALDKPMFSKSLLTRRCVIPSTGFYVWAQMEQAEKQLSLFANQIIKTAKQPKTKLLFRLPDEPMLYMAGMLGTFTDQEGKAKEAFVILTTDANASMSPYHDRMPVILAADECTEWINNDAFMRAVLMRECRELVWVEAS